MSWHILENIVIYLVILGCVIAGLVYRDDVPGGGGVGGSVSLYETLHAFAAGVFGCGVWLGGADGLCGAGG